MSRLRPGERVSFSKQEVDALKQRMDLLHSASQEAQGRAQQAQAQLASERQDRGAPSL